MSVGCSFIRYETAVSGKLLVVNSSRKLTCRQSALRSGVRALFQALENDPDDAVLFSGIDIF